MLVTLVDDDESVRESLPDLVRVLGYEANAFASAEAFLVSDTIDQAGCLILDVAMPGMGGPELLQELKRRGSKTPVIFITALKDEAVRARLLAQGACDCLFKPFSDSALYAAIKQALAGA